MTTSASETKLLDLDEARAVLREARDGGPGLSTPERGQSISRSEAAAAIVKWLPTDQVDEAIAFYVAEGWLVPAGDGFLTALPAGLVRCSCEAYMGYPTYPDPHEAACPLFGDDPSWFYAMHPERSLSPRPETGGGDHLTSLEVLRELPGEIDWVPALEGEGWYAALARDESFYVPVRYNVGRNDPCPCGSGVKFKRCHGT